MYDQFAFPFSKGNSGWYCSSSTSDILLNKLWMSLSEYSTRCGFRCRTRRPVNIIRIKIICHILVTNCCQAMERIRKISVSNIKNCNS